MGEHNVTVLEEDKVRTGTPSSSEEGKGGETTKGCFGEPSSHKEKNSLDDQLITGKPNTLNKTNILEEHLQTG